MKEAIQEKKTFAGIDYSDKILPDKEFDTCEFINCNFSKSDLSNSDFIDCKFENCNLSMVNFNNTGLKNVNFIGSKLLGIDFTRCNDFLLSFYFEKCILDYSTFHKKKMKKTIFKDCTI